MARFLIFWVGIRVLLSPLGSLRTAKTIKIIFLTFISNFLLLYFFEPSIFTFINILFILIMVTTVTIATAVLTATIVYKVIITRVRAGFLILFIISFISWSCPSSSLLYLFLSYLISLIIVSS